MIISKAIELLTYLSYDSKEALTHDDSVAICLGIKALKRLVYCRQHAGAQWYVPLPGENIPDRGIQAVMQSRQTKKTKRA